MARVLPSVLHHNRYCRLDEAGVVGVPGNGFWIREIVKTQMQCPSCWDPHPIAPRRLPAREEERHRYLSNLVGRIEETGGLTRDERVVIINTLAWNIAFSDGPYPAPYLHDSFTRE